MHRAARCHPPGPPTGRRGPRALALTLCGVALAGLTACALPSAGPPPATPSPAPTPTPEVRITGPSAAVYAGPGNLDFPQLPAPLANDTRLTPLGRYGDFVKLEWIDGSGTAQTGYVLVSALTGLPPDLPELTRDQVPWVRLPAFTNATTGYKQEAVPGLSAVSDAGWLRYDFELVVDDTQADQAKAPANGFLVDNAQKGEDLRRAYVICQTGGWTLDLSNGQHMRILVTGSRVGRFVLRVSTDGKEVRAARYSADGQTVEKTAVFTDGLFARGGALTPRIQTAAGSTVTLSIPPAGKYSDLTPTPTRTPAPTRTPTPRPTVSPYEGLTQTISLDYLRLNGWRIVDNPLYPTNEPFTHRIEQGSQQYAVDMNTKILVKLEPPNNLDLNTVKRLPAMKTRPPEGVATFFAWQYIDGFFLAVDSEFKVLRTPEGWVYAWELGAARQLPPTPTPTVTPTRTPTPTAAPTRTPTKVPTPVLNPVVPLGQRRPGRATGMLPLDHSKTPLSGDYYPYADEASVGQRYPYYSDDPYHPDYLRGKVATPINIVSIDRNSNTVSYSLKESGPIIGSFVISPKTRVALVTDIVGTFAQYQLVGLDDILPGDNVMVFFSTEEALPAFLQGQSVSVDAIVGVR